jgi:uroporphyrinogen decarboxylase
MTRRERIEAAFHGGSVDRVPVSFWQHFPGRDHRADLLAAATVDYQRRYDLDVIKLMPTGMYSVVDYGVTVMPSEDAIGTTRHVSGPVRGPEDWARLRPVSPAQGVLAEQVRAAGLVRAALGPDVPVLQTVFSPLTMVAKILGAAAPAQILSHESALASVLDRLADDVIAFGLACLAAGVDGFFFATQLAVQTGALPAIYARFGVPYDLKVLHALRPRAWALVLHLHGDHPLFDLADAYPIDAVNWHARETAPSLAEGMRRTRRGLMGGVARLGAVLHGPTDEVIREVREAVAQTGGQRLIVAPGCVLPTTAPEEHLMALRRAVGA